MTGIAVVIAGMLGLAIGSFLNVVVYRVPRGESVVRPRSRCTRCGAAVRPRDEVPVLSWLLLHGKCRDCSAPVSVRYPLVELGTALLFAGLTWRLGVTAALPAYLYLAAVGIALAIIDLDVKRLPNSLTFPSYAVGLALLAVAASVGHDGAALLRAIVAMAVCYAGFFALRVIHPRGMGFGDVKLAGVLGLYLGWLGWGSVAVGIFAGFLLGGVTGVVLIAGGQAGRKTKVPFGPFMLVGALVAIVAGQELAHSYIRLTTG